MLGQEGQGLAWEVLHQVGKDIQGAGDIHAMTEGGRQNAALKSAKKH